MLLAHLKISGPYLSKFWNLLCSILIVLILRWTYEIVFYLMSSFDLFDFPIIFCPFTKPHILMNRWNIRFQIKHFWNEHLIFTKIKDIPWNFCQNYLGSTNFWASSILSFNQWHKNQKIQRRTQEHFSESDCIILSEIETWSNITILQDHKNTKTESITKMRPEE